MDGGSTEQPPPALLSIDEIYTEYGFATIDHAPYIDEETAEYIRTINDLREEVDALEGEIDDLEGEVKALKNEAKVASNSVSDSDKPAVEHNEGQAKVKDAAPVKQATGQTFNTSYYGMDCAGCTGITASGLNVKVGQTHYNGMRILAADTSILPLHTRVKVTNPDGSSYVGIVKDRGGAIKGHKLDVLVGSEAESSSHGRHDAKVEVIERGDNSYRRE